MLGQQRLLLRQLLRQLLGSLQPGPEQRRLGLVAGLAGASTQLLHLLSRGARLCGVSSDQLLLQASW